jgi:hypothetical protein
VDDLKEEKILEIERVNTGSQGSRFGRVCGPVVRQGTELMNLSIIDLIISNSQA